MDLTSKRKEDAMDAMALLRQARESMSGTMVFGEPYERDGLTVIPAAAIRGGGGGGGGPDGTGGSGGGYGVMARPVGAFLIRGDQVEWRPAFDPNRAVEAGAAVAVVALLSVRSILKARTKARAVRAALKARARSERRGRA
jgi:uncharacterized spore protein YtfJ